MKRPIIAILKGPMASGKSTAFANLRKHPKMKNWVFVEFSAVKDIFAGLGDEKRRKFGNQALLAILKNVMKTKRNILLEEFSQRSLRKYLNHHIKKYNYELITFQLEAELQHTHHRNIQRSKARGVKPQTKKQMKENILHHTVLRKPHPDAILVNTSELNQKQTVNFILKQLK